MPGELERGRDAFERRAWKEAFRLLRAADERDALDGEHLELLATAAYLAGSDDAYLAALERAHRAHAGAGRNRRAARCAFWLGLRLLFRGEAGRANGWLARARRLLQKEPRHCAEQGYLLLPLVEQQLRAGDYAAAHATAERAAQIGDGCGDPDLGACARYLQGRALVHQGEVLRGLTLLDEAMLAVASGMLTPVMTGLTYCSAIELCQSVYALDRAREWTAALAAWCEAQPEMVAFTGVCLAHRAEILQLRGAWEQALAEARRACERCALANNREARGAAFYQEAQVHRLRGELGRAEAAYRKASESGWDPQPGLALLRLAQGRPDAAAGALRRALGAATGPLEKARLLPAHVEIMLAVQALDEARAACEALEEIARGLPAGMPQAMAAQARGALNLAQGDATAALPPLRAAWRAWQDMQAPYPAARVRALIGLACRALGDADGAELELEAARSVFKSLGAAPDLEFIRSLAASGAPQRAHGLTPRELQVLRLVAAGKTNKAIARELSLSEKTVDRHVSNIFGKLDVASRTAAATYGYRHKLI
jgi:DNA-binding CsgD family transcriptional regulator